MTERIRISTDISTLFPGEPITIGDQTIQIRPLGLEQISDIVKRLKKIVVSLNEKDITFENFNTPEKIIDLSVMLIEQFPEVLEEASNIHIDDLKILPPSILAEIIAKVIEVNLNSKEDLEKNLKSLIDSFKMTMKNQKKEENQK